MFSKTTKVTVADVRERLGTAVLLTCEMKYVKEEKEGTIREGSVRISLGNV